MNEIDMNAGFKKMFDNLVENGILRYDEEKPLYKYVSIGTAKLIIGTGTIKFSSPHDLDDNDLDVSLLDLTITPNVQNLITKNILRKNLNPGLVEILEKELDKPNSQVRIPPQEFIDNIINGYIEERKRYGVFCLTTDNRNGKMWQEYADNYNGVCLEFRFPNLFTKLYHTFTVAYNSNLKLGRLFNDDGTLNSLTVNKWLFTKNEKYANECEVRLLTENKGIYPFPKRFLNNIYYGKDISLEDSNELERLLREGDYSFYKGEKY